MREWLINIRKSSDYSPKSLAVKCNVARSYYNQIENGKRNPSVPLAQRIAELLSFDWTLFFENAEGVGSESNID